MTPRQPLRPKVDDIRFDTDSLDNKAVMIP
jgi:hypothetical protein